MRDVCMRDMRRALHQVAKPVYRALQLLNKLASGRMFRSSDAQPQADNVDVWGTLDDSLQIDAKHAVFVTNFNVSCDAKPLPARQLNLTLRTSSGCTPSHATVCVPRAFPQCFFVTFCAGTRGSSRSKRVIL